MNTNEFKDMNGKISLLYALKEDMQKKIVNGEIWDQTDKITLQSIRELSLQTIADILAFCKKECDDIDNKKTFIIETITGELEENFNKINPEKVALSDLNAIMPTIVKINQYMQGCTTQQSFSDIQESNDTQKVLVVNEELKKLKQLLNFPCITFTPDNFGSYLDVNLYTKMKEQQTVAVLIELNQLVSKSFFAPDVEKYQDIMRAISFINQLKNIFNEKRNAFELYVSKKRPIDADVLKHTSDTSIKKTSNIKKTFNVIMERISNISAKKTSDDAIKNTSDDVVDTPVVSSHEIKKTDYLYRLTADWNNLLTNFNISEEITEDNYTDILEEYREYLCSHEKRKQFEKLLGKRAAVYKSNRSRNNREYRMGEAMIFVQEFFKKKQEETEEDDQFEVQQQEQQKELKQHQEQLRQQSVYFPQIIQLLEQFKEIFKAEYLSKSPAEIREAFVQQYSSLVLKPAVELHPELLSLSEKETNSLDSSHRKKEFHEGIMSVISKGSDVLIERGVSQGFIFGEIDDLIQNLQKIYEHNKH